MSKLSEEQERKAVEAFVEGIVMRRPMEGSKKTVNDIMRICTKEFPYFSEATIFNTILELQNARALRV